MARYLVVANQTLASPELIARVHECILEGPCTFHIVVPATHAKEQVNFTEGAARSIAQRRLEAALHRFRELEVEGVDGEVGDPNPVLAINDALRDDAFDAIILSTLPPGPSRWLKQDLPHRVERRFSLPVIHLVGTLEPAPAPH